MRFAFFARLALFAFLLLAMSGASYAQVRVAITIGPPVIPVYEQPICPGDGYIWTPGYWDYDYDVSDYYWVPGTWVLAPEVGFFWTPGYWGWGGAAFVWYAGYWGPTVGFYGGINYGFGYFGHGYEGGRWDNGHFFYNTTVNRVDVNVIHNVYNTRITDTNNSRVSFNGGRGGINARPTSAEEAAAHERHVEPVAAQTEHAQAARSDPQQRASMNHGAPPVAATTKAGTFKDSGVVRAGGAGAPGNAAARPEGNASRPAVHPNDLPAIERPAAPNTGNAKQDQKYQQQQQKLQAQQQQERQKLQQQQDKEHQQAAQLKANPAKQQQLEQKHQQQTQQLQQKHQQQTQQLQQKQSSPPKGGKPPKK